MAKKTIADVEVKSKRVLVRVDFNVPLDDSGTITDDRRIRLALPTIRHVIEHGGRLILMSHLGRPGGKGFEAAYSMKPIADRLRELLPGTTVLLGEQDPVSEDALKKADALQDGEVLVLENLRFNPGEKKNEERFAHQLASMASLYCNDAFGTAHREDASMLGVPNAMGDRMCVAGFLLAKELKYLSDTIEHAKKPFVAVLGGAKVSDKLGAIDNLLGRVDMILVGGAMAYTFLMAQEIPVGRSRVESNMIEAAREALSRAQSSSTEVCLPIDHVCAREFGDSSSVQVCSRQIPDELMGLDIGPETAADYAERLRSAKTIVWNGPMGVFETPPFDIGTRTIAAAIVEATAGGAISVIGGGDSAAAVESFGLAEHFSHVSTGGGASLQMLEGKPFKSVEVLDDEI